VSPHQPHVAIDAQSSQSVAPSHGLGPPQYVDSHTQSEQVPPEGPQ
jgi:hypothetical protein